MKRASSAGSRPPGGARVAQRRRPQLERRDQQHDAGREPDAESDGAGALLETDRDDDAEQCRQA
jgi:hypothetical protein